MKFDNDWLLKIFTDTDFITQLTSFIKTLNGIANLALIIIFVSYSYQGIREVLSWFN